MFNERTFDKQTFDCEKIHKSNKCSDCEKIRESVYKINQTTISPHDENNSIHCEKVHKSLELLNFYGENHSIKFNQTKLFKSFYVVLCRILWNPLKSVKTEKKESLKIFKKL